MSRLIVKNLPKGITQDKLRSTFSEKGYVTDVQLKYTKDGAFRRFGFVGFKKEEEAKAALEFFNNTCIGSSRIQVEICADLGSADKPRPWSKYAKGTTAYNKLHPEEIAAAKKTEEDTKIAVDKKKKKKKEKEALEDPKLKELLEKYKDDPMFAEFMEAHLGKNNIWGNDVLGGTGDGPAADENTLEELKKSVQNSIPEEDVASAKISDFEYLRRKMVKNDLTEKTSKTNDITEKTSDTNDITEKTSKPKKCSLNDDGTDEDDDNDKKQPQETHKKAVLFTVKLRGLPYKAKKKDVKEFLQPLKPKSIRVPTKVKSIAYAGFATEKEQKKALIKNRSFMSGKRITVVPYDGPKSGEKEHLNNGSAPWHDQEESLKFEETIAESGRIFVRNLPYTVTEEEIQNLFSKYGELSEVLLPVDQHTRKIKGFALVTFLLPEHAVRAFSELDGTAFEGRMLHLLPAKSKPSIDELLQQEGLDYKTKKALLQKKLATLSHNWNTLFLGQNAITDLIADTYNTTKENVLDDSGKGSVAVRLALGETQIVAETRKFLIDNGVQLDAFNKPVTQRSKKVILIKNLPAKTQPIEIRELFEPYGVVGRVILPPSGVTGLVEFMESSEAKRAFLKLAYTKFKNLPLYLEWAPAEALNGTGEEGSEPATEEKTFDGAANRNEQDDDDDDEEEPESDTTLYLKNLSFNTTENDLKRHFKQCGSVASAMIASKPNPKQAGERLSQGYGFIQFFKKKSADDALKLLQNSSLDGHKIEIKRSHRTLKTEAPPRKNANQAKQTGTKILVRNIPFQATRDEIIELFKVFGDVKAIRLPKKMVGTGSHRGFAFVDFHTKNDAKRAMESLCQSTHLYGRRLVLEWASSEEEDVDAIRKRTAERFGQDEPAAKTSKKSVFDMKSASKGAADDEDESN